MSARKFLAALLLAVMAASCSFAEVTTLQILQDVRFSPHIPATKLNGPSLLPGRYIVAENIASRTGSQPIIAPAKTILEIGQFSAETNAYPFHLDVHGKGKADGRVTLDIQSEAPILTFYTADKSGQYKPDVRVYAVLIQDRDYAWLTGAVSDGEMSFLFPVSDINFPEGWYLGEWLCEDGTQFTLEGDKISSGGHEIGTFTVEDDRITVTAKDGSTDTIYAMRNPASGTLIMTFTSGPNGMGMNAGSFVNTSRNSKPAAPKIPVTPAPESKPVSPNMPTEFPPMPKVDLPAPSLNINGVWGAYYNGHQLITQFQDSNYYGWIDGQPSEMGIISIEGNKITGSNNKGVDFTAELELDASGKFLDMRFPNGNTIHYQRLQ
ncbi:MAG: hypothetical protein IJR63_04835 [Synergistaceae bacterium]|nr:hypothetical protein [Synergistaceae bacterium]